MTDRDWDIHWCLLRLERLRRIAERRWRDGTVSGKDYYTLKHYVAGMWQRYYQLQEDVQGALAELSHQNHEYPTRD